MWPADLAPDHADLGATALDVATVDVGDLLAKVELGGLGVIDTLNLDERGGGSLDVLGALVAQVTTLDV